MRSLKCVKSWLLIINPRTEGSRSKHREKIIRVCSQDLRKKIVDALLPNMEQLHCNLLHDLKDQARYGAKHWCKQYRAEKVEADTTLTSLQAQCPATLTKPEKRKRPK